MTLNELIREAASASHQITTGDIPLKLNGKEITDAKFRIHLDGDCVMYCDMILGHDEDIIPEEEAYQNGYLAGLKERLTWEDVKRIVEIADSLLPYASVKHADLEHEFQSEEDYYKAVLKKYEDGK